MQEHTEGVYSKKGKQTDVGRESDISQQVAHQDYVRRAYEVEKPPDLVHTDSKFVERHFKNYKQRYHEEVYEKKEDDDDDDGDTYIKIDTKVKGAKKDSYETSVFLKEGHIVSEIAYRKKPPHPMELEDYAFDSEEEGPKGTYPEHLNTILAGNVWTAINTYGSKYGLNDTSNFDLKSLGFYNIPDGSTVADVNKLLGQDEYEKSITKEEQGFEGFFQDSFGRSAAEFMKYFPRKEIEEIEIECSRPQNNIRVDKKIVKNITFWVVDKNPT